MTNVFSKIDAVAASPEFRRKGFPIVGLGASAGGLEACTELIKNLPADTGMAFVLVQHLAPEHESLLPELLANSTTMPVLQVRNGMKVEPNQFYVIPPNATMAINHGVLKLLPRQSKPGPQRCIDMFFESLAQDRGHEAIGVILSGTASDGTLGLEAIKGEGGVTFAQDDSARFNSMPRSAVAAGCVDFVMPPGEIARELNQIARHPFVRRVEEATEREPPEVSDGFKQILHLVCRTTGIDFNYYKPGMLDRRIKRRMVLKKIESLQAYTRFLNSHPDEVEALGQDFLIGVTSFFRDPSAFEFLQKKIFPLISKAREQEGLDGPVRVWVPGCSSGQEVYSIAIAWLEYTEGLGTDIPMQIFGTDVNETYLEKARAAVYPKSLILDVSKERLRRFFVEVEAGYRVNKPVREMCVFALQNLTSDPPFSRMDLISCRNLLIYLELEVQKRILSILHFSLKPHAFLFMGRAETTSSLSELYAPVDRRYKVFVKKASAAVSMHFKPHLFATRNTAAPIFGTPPPAGSSGIEAQREADKLLLSRYAPASVVINSDFEIMQFRGHTGPFLEAPPGRATLNLLKMARGSLHADLRSAVQKARRHQSAKEKGLKVNQNGRTLTVDLEVVSLKGTSGDKPHFLVLFQPVGDVSGLPVSKKSARSAKGATGARADPSELLRVQRELTDTKAHLQAVINEQETYVEELQAANEEAQAGNEELQSVNEELETSKEELQATNEELGTINAELHARNAELGQANQELKRTTESRDYSQAIINTLHEPLVVLRPDLRVNTANRAFYQLFNTAPQVTDGQLIYELGGGVWNFPEFRKLLEQTIPRNHSFTDFEITRDFGRGGRTLLLNARTIQAAKGGPPQILLAMEDVTERRKSEEAMRASELRYRRLFESAKDGVLVLNPETQRIIDVNPYMVESLGYSRPEFIGKKFWEVGLLEDEAANRAAFAQLRQQGVIRYDELPLQTKTGERRTVELVCNVYDEANQQVIQCNIRDVTERQQTLKSLRQAQAQLAEHAEQLERAVAERTAELAERNKQLEAFVYSIAHDLRAPLRSMQGFSALLVTEAKSTLSPTAQDYAERINRSSQFMDQSLVGLLNFSHITMQQIELIPIKLETALQSTLTQLEAQIQERQARIEAAGPWPTVLAHEMTLGQVLLNLIGNAIKFVPPNVTPVVRIRTEERKEPARAMKETSPASTAPIIRVWVEDNGVGIPEEQQGKLFRLFGRLRGRDYAGTGLGLAIVKEGVRRMGGDVGVESEANRGSRFWFELRRAP